MSIDVKHKGDLQELKATFRDEDDTLVDPSTVSLKVMDPSGNVDEYTAVAGLTRESLGVYFTDIELDESGDWHYWWTSTGSGEGAEPGQITVAPTPF